MPLEIEPVAAVYDDERDIPRFLDGMPHNKRRTTSLPAPISCQRLNGREKSSSKSLREAFLSDWHLQKRRDRGATSQPSFPSCAFAERRSSRFLAISRVIFSRRSFSAAMRSWVRLSGSC